MLAPSIAVLLVVNLFLGVAALLIPSGWWVRRFRRAQFVPKADAESATLDALAAALDSDPQHALSALSEIAARPDAYVSTLVSLVELSAVAPAPVRFGAIRAVRSILAKEPTLLPACWPDARPLARRAVLAGFMDQPLPVWTGAPSAAALVRDAIADADPFVRRHACSVLARIDPRTAIALATQTLNDADADVRRLAISYLADHGGAEELATLIRAIAADHGSDRPSLVYAAGAIGRRAPRSLLALASDTADVPARLAAIAVIGATGSLALARELATTLGDRSRDLRRAAAAAISNSTRMHPAGSLPDEIVQALAARLEHETSKSVLLAVLEAVEASADSRLHAVLARRAPQIEPAVSQRAMEVLAEFEGRRHPSDTSPGLSRLAAGSR